MEYIFYIQGIHAVRVGLEDGIIETVERFDFSMGDFVSDFKLINRINDNLDCKKVSEKEFCQYIMLSHKQSLN